jgi:hypothetical protein
VTDSYAELRLPVHKCSDVIVLGCEETQPFAVVRVFFLTLLVAIRITRIL